MENTSDSIISFTYYDASKYILHTNDGKHFIVGISKKKEIENILNNSNPELREKIIEKIKNFKGGDGGGYMLISDFQFKKAIITESKMEALSKPFTFLFNNIIFYPLILIILFVLPYFYFFSENHTQKYVKINYSWIIFFIVYMFHEIGHASACLKYKVKASEIGFGITSFFPVMYANVSDSQTKRIKIIV